MTNYEQKRNESDSVSFDAGFQYAIDLLRNVDEQTNGGITKCLHSVEWANYLEKQKESENAV